MRCEDVQGRRNELDFDLGVCSVLRFGSAESVLDCVDALVAETGDFDICADFCWLRCKTFADVGLKFLLDDFAGEVDLCPYVWVALGCQQILNLAPGPAYVIESLKASTA